MIRVLVVDDDESARLFLGSILEAAGRTAEAREAYAQTLASIDTLPTSRRNNRAVERLENEAREAMRRLDAGGQPE